ncbi:hypothetical protein BDR04DRAFT_894732 [Suillus decipiens]|nr:hypothetical protein BDR04DRAFT_894732 [Suillus decipiens]
MILGSYCIHNGKYACIHINSSAETVKATNTMITIRSRSKSMSKEFTLSTTWALIPVCERSAPITMTEVYRSPRSSHNKYATLISCGYNI